MGKNAGHFEITTFGNGVVIVTALAQVGVTAQSSVTINVWFVNIR